MQTVKIVNLIANRFVTIGTAFLILLLLGIACYLGLENNVPVYMYHSISQTPWDIDESLFVTPSNFEEQINLLVESGFTSIFASDLPSYNIFKKNAVLTFDDGYEDNYTYAYPILKKYNVKATIFVVSGSIGKPHYLTAEQIKELSDSGLVSIQSHTASHLDLSRCTPDELDYELTNSKKTLESITNKNVTVISYPSGKKDDNVIKETSKSYKIAFITFGADSYKQKNALETPRAGIFRSTNIQEFKKITFERSRNRFQNFMIKLKGQ